MSLTVEPFEALSGDPLTAYLAIHKVPAIVSRGRLHDVRALPGFLAREVGEMAGILTWHRDGDGIEVVTLDSFVWGRGAGTALLRAMIGAGRAVGVQRLWLITTNDITHAIRFYQRQGWNMCAFHRDALEASRKLKPEIPFVGDDAIPIRHEIEFERRF